MPRSSILTGLGINKASLFKGQRPIPSQLPISRDGTFVMNVYGLSESFISKLHYRARQNEQMLPLSGGFNIRDQLYELDEITSQRGFNAFLNKFQKICGISRKDQRTGQRGEAVSLAKELFKNALGEENARFAFDGVNIVFLSENSWVWKSNSHSGEHIAIQAALGFIPLILIKDGFELARTISTITHEVTHTAFEPARHNAEYPALFDIFNEAVTEEITQEIISEGKEGVAELSLPDSFPQIDRTEIYASERSFTQGLIDLGYGEEIYQMLIGNSTPFSQMIGTKNIGVIERIGTFPGALRESLLPAAILSLSKSWSPILKRAIELASVKIDFEILVQDLERHQFPQLVYIKPISETTKPGTTEPTQDPSLDRPGSSAILERILRRHDFHGLSLFLANEAIKDMLYPTPDSIIESTPERLEWALRRSVIEILKEDSKTRN